MTAAVPDPRFRDQLAEAAIVAVGDMAADWWCPKREGVRRDECRYCIAEVVVDALTTEVEARVQAAANQGAAEELEALRARLAADEDAPTDAALEGLDFTLRVLAARAAALASPAPAPHAER